MSSLMSNAIKFWTNSIYSNFLLKNSSHFLMRLRHCHEQSSEGAKQAQLHISHPNLADLLHFQSWAPCGGKLQANSLLTHIDNLRNMSSPQRVWSMHIMLHPKKQVFLRVNFPTIWDILDLRSGVKLFWFSFWAHLSHNENSSYSLPIRPAPGASVVYTVTLNVWIWWIQTESTSIDSTRDGRAGLLQHLLDPHASKATGEARQYNGTKSFPKKTYIPSNIERIYIHTHIHTYTYTHTHIHTYTHIHIHTYTHTHIQYTHTHIHTYSTHIQHTHTVHTYTHTHIQYTHTHIHTYTHTHIHTYIT